MKPWLGWLETPPPFRGYHTGTERPVVAGGDVQHWSVLATIPFRRRRTPKLAWSTRTAPVPTPPGTPRPDGLAGARRVRIRTSDAPDSRRPPPLVPACRGVPPGPGVASGGGCRAAPAHRARRTTHPRPGVARRRRTPRGRASPVGPTREGWSATLRRRGRISAGAGTMPRDHGLAINAVAPGVAMRYQVRRGWAAAASVQDGSEVSWT